MQDQLYTNIGWKCTPCKEAKIINSCMLRIFYSEFLLKAVIFLNPGLTLTIELPARPKNGVIFPKFMELVCVGGGD